MTETAPRPTLEAVAARAGVSRATVSRVVNGGDGVREPLVERVRRAVEELGYVPNQAARSLVTRRHDAVAVVIAEPETRVFADPFFGRQLRGISKELAVHDNQLVLLLTEGRDDHARVARYLAGGHVDGALVFSLHLDDPLPGLIRGAGVPMVIGGRPGWDGEGRGGGAGVGGGGGVGRSGEGAGAGRGARVTWSGEGVGRGARVVWSGEGGGDGGRSVGSGDRAGVVGRGGGAGGGRGGVGSGGEGWGAGSGVGGEGGGVGSEVEGGGRGTGSGSRVEGEGGVRGRGAGSGVGAGDGGGRGAGVRGDAGAVTSAGEWRGAWGGGGRVGGPVVGERGGEGHGGVAGGGGGAFGGGATLYVDSDNRGGAQDAVRHLVGLGRARVAHITGPLDQTSAVDRLDGYLDVVGDTDPALLAEGDFTPAGGEHAMRELLARRPDLDAVFAANDLSASGALRVLREQGRRVPEDVAVIGFDDMLPIPEQTDPPLTTVRQDIEEMGRLMTRLLLHRLSRTPSPGPDTPQGSVVLPTRLIRRASA